MKARIVIAVLLLLGLAGAVSAHDAPANESPKEIHAIYVAGEECHTPQCSSSWFYVLLTAMDGQNSPKKRPDGYRINWRPQDGKWRSHKKANRLNRGNLYIEHQPVPDMIFYNSDQGHMSLFITDQICVPFGDTLEVRVRPIYNGKKNGPWTHGSTRTGDSGWGEGWDLPERNLTCPGDAIGAVGNVDN